LRNQRDEINRDISENGGDRNGWLEHELARRFNYACCPDLEAFRRESKALTRSGQIKASGERHEKDDRHAIDDRTRYVLGWTNEAKIEAIEKQVRDLETRIGATGTEVARAENERKRLREREGFLNKISMHREFGELDWRSLTRDIQRAEKECAALEQASDILRALRIRLAEVDREWETVETDLGAAVKEQATVEAKQEVARTSLAEARELLDATPAEIQDRLFPQLEEMRTDAIEDRPLTVESCDKRQTEMRE
jgi:uncharacterized protein YPO0396